MAVFGAVFREVSGAMTRHPRSRVQFCHCTASAPSTSAIAGVFGGCASSTPPSRLMTQTRANPFGQLLDIIDLLQGCHREHEPIVLFQIDLELFGELRQFGGILDIGLMLGL